MGKQYSITINNQASHSASFMLFQSDPGAWSPNALAVAWFAKKSNPSPTSRVKFIWTVDIGLSWADTGPLGPGAIYQASETFDPTGTLNQVTLDYNGAYFFSNPVKGADPARIYLQESPNIPVASGASVGVTMSGKPVYATQAMPNTNLTFSPKASYYLAYGNFEEGTVIDVSTINNALLLPYPTGIYSLETTLNADNSWTPPVPVSVANAKRVRVLEPA